MQDQKDQLDKWADMWEKSQRDGVFDNAPQPPASSPQTANSSYFGLVNTHPTEEIQDVDANYWNQVYHSALQGEMEPDPLGDSLIQESEDQKRASEVAKAMAQSPNPVRGSSVGEDQSMEKGPLGVTFSPEEIEELSELKKKLHALKDEANTVEGKGGRSKKFESKIKNIKDQIDKLSTEFTKSFPDAVMPQGD
jgi:hypothetical protein